MSMVILDRLTRKFNGMAALNGLSLDIPAGQMVALLGPSGCGKTTALKIIAGLDAPTSGDVRIGGASVLGQPPQARSAVMVFQNQLLFPHMTVAQNIGFGLRMRGLPSAAAVDEMLERVQMTGLGARKPADLSGGQAQRVALARALILRPKVLLLDEPLSSLDANLRGEMRDLICAVQADLGVTTLLVTHDQSEAVQMAQGIALMSKGRLVQYGSAHDFYARPNTVAAARFFGGVNFVGGMGTGTGVQTALGLMAVAGNGAGVVTIRPERIVLGQGSWTGQIVQKTYLGTQTRLRVMVGDQMLEISAGPDFGTSETAGETAGGLAGGMGTVRLDLPPAALWFIPASAE